MLTPVAPMYQVEVDVSRRFDPEEKVEVPVVSKKEISNTYWYW